MLLTLPVDLRLEDSFLFELLSLPMIHPGPSSGPTRAARVSHPTKPKVTKPKGQDFKMSFGTLFVGPLQVFVTTRQTLSSEEMSKIKIDDDGGKNTMFQKMYKQIAEVLNILILNEAFLSASHYPHPHSIPNPNLNNNPNPNLDLYRPISSASPSRKTIR